MSFDQFMKQFGGDTSESNGTDLLTSAAEKTLTPLDFVSEEGALDAFIDKFNGVTEPYFFYNGSVELRFQTDEHIYYLVGELGQLTPQDGVTTICHIIDKSNALVPWAAKVVVQKILNTAPKAEKEANGGFYLPEMHWDAFEKLLLDAKSAPNDAKVEAGDVGHMAHTWLEYYIKSVIALRVAEETGNLDAQIEHRQAIESKLANLPGDERAASCVKAALAWMKAHNVQWLETERKIYSKKYSYAGTMDGLAYVSSCDDPTCCSEHFVSRLSLIDWKSSNYLYIEYLYQTAAYEAAYEEEFDADVADRWIIRLGKADGEFDPWHTLPEDFQEDFEGFLDALSLSRSVKLTNERMKDQKHVRKEIRKKLKEAAKEAEMAQRKQARAELVAANREKKAQEKEQKKAAAKAERAALRNKPKELRDAEALLAKIVPIDENSGTITGRISIEKPEFIELDKEDAEVFVDAVTNPPEPNEKLKAAAKIFSFDLSEIEQRVLATLPAEEVVKYSAPQLPKES
jgi:hypothetical protein